MNIVVMGAQWGDEGKGKIVDYLAQDAKYVCRFSGGSNAGHSIVTEGKRFSLHQVPSGILYKDKVVILGSDMVLDPEALFNELKMLKDNGVDWEGRVLISDRVQLVLPGYREMDKKIDEARRRPIGTTGRGIGVAYSQKASRDGLRLCDVEWQEKLDDLAEEDRKYIEHYRDKLLSMSVNIASLMYNLKGENILFEGAQGAMLDIDCGSYPYVTSGASGSYGAACGTGIGPRNINKVYAVFKAYETRVGNGPMPSEFNEDGEKSLCDFVRKTGNEYGVTTGRARRCGYLDLVALRYACMINSIDTLCMTHLDVYDTLDEVQVCVGYTINRMQTLEFPSAVPDLNAARPVLKTLKGWKTPIKDIRKFNDLPKEAREYIKFIEDYTGTKIGIISVGPDREQTIMRGKVWGK